MYPFPTDTPTRFTLSMPGADHDFKVLSFKGREALNQPYRFDVELVSERADLALESLLHQPAYLAFGQAGAGIHGQVHGIAQGESGKRLTRYHLTLVPRLAYLAHARQQRIFQEQSVPQIIAQVLEEHAILADSYRFTLGPTVYPPREYCTQYDESDLEFIQRLCAEEGLSYHFQHSRDRHLLVFGDDQTVFPRLQSTAYQQDTGMAAQGPVVNRFGVRLETRTSHVCRRDYDFLQPHILLEARQGAAQGENPQPRLEDYDYPGEFRDDTRATLLSRRALERQRSDYQLAEGRSDQPALACGHFLPLAAHPRQAWNDLWLLTEVAHEGRQPQVLEESITSDTDTGLAGFHQGYRNTFSATPWQTPYRPPLEHRRHVIHGSQSATVTGPPGEEVFCDAFGRVKVQFPWDRNGQADEHSSCWLRVATPWAGPHYGSVVIPRIGMEVEVSYFEGDPDRPYVSACMPNRLNPVPYPLPENRTQSVFKSSSVPGGEGFNEIRIEDRRGEEQVFVHAERDWTQITRHDHTVDIGNQRHTRVNADSFTELKAEEHRITHGDRKVALKASDHLDIAHSQHVRAGTGQYVEAGRELHFKAGDKVVIEAGVELTLQAGGCFIKLDPSGIWCNGVMIGLNAGGNAGQGSGLQLLSPLGAEPPPAPLAAAQVKLMRTAQANASDQCLICEACQEGLCVPT
ncbi:type VI secretion system tip protein VgrG [Pseudomonas sp. 148P]|uniref:Type VI secretion system tip protein VgrG n=1 Tax=Pseudomonas ulcerans TaxID=3115852 RepID=A0ABU7HUL0_9PSED|nr:MULTISPECIES: type VI secretion system tip protein VgrG [unclassified Pseudomonas]MEE1924017.1 type VI secretion system tip protein VgrG [Pseudomonas sp. 147P]MEE1935220.1 type VI secretion system tip protein VgrG [Pseudomonas sp. 148P]